MYQAKWEKSTRTRVCGWDEKKKTNEEKKKGILLNDILNCNVEFFSFHSDSSRFKIKWFSHGVTQEIDSRFEQRIKQGSSQILR